MKSEHLRPKPGYFEQLALGLGFDAEERSESGFVSPDEARRRSQAARKALQAAGVEESPDWFDQYQALLSEGWPWRIACYIAWAASPKRNRWPATQGELAMLVLGLTSPRQIHTWRKKYPEIDEVISVLQAAPMLEHRADAILALAQSASDPDHRHNPDRKLFFEMTGDWQPGLRVEMDRTSQTDDLSAKSEEELARLERAVRARLENGEEAGRGESGDTEG